MSSENCELLVKAQSLAVRRGLDVSKVVCPVIEWCKGERCHLIDPDDPESNFEMMEDLNKYEHKVDRSKLK